MRHPHRILFFYNILKSSSAAFNRSLTLNGRLTYKLIEKWRREKEMSFSLSKWGNQRFMLNKGGGRVVVTRPRYIKGLIEHKIIRARTGAAAILFGRREVSASKRFFFRTSSRDWTETREQLLGPCYPNPKILLLRDPLLLSSCPRPLFLTKTNFIPGR